MIFFSGGLQQDAAIVTKCTNMYILQFHMCIECEA